MKKVILSVTVLLFALSASAQFKGGFFAGINGSQVDGDNFAGFYKLGLNIGPTVFIPLSKRFDVSMEILYSQKGSQSKVVEGFPRQYFLKLDYLEVPLLLNYHDDTKGLDKVTLFAGASINRLVFSKEEVNNANPYNAASQTQALYQWDYDWVAGGSYRFAGNWVINARYSRSLSSIGVSLDSRYPNQAMYNNFVTVRLGYIIQGKAGK